MEVNTIGRAHVIFILDIRLYQVEIPRGEVTKITVNVIAELMYAQCDAEGSEYLLLDSLIDHWKSDNAITLANQETSVWSRLVTQKLMKVD